MKPGPIVYGPHGEEVSNMYLAMVPDEENKANALLIAQAPELLEQRDSLLNALECTADSLGMLAAIFQTLGNWDAYRHAKAAEQQARRFL